MDIPLIPSLVRRRRLNQLIEALGRHEEAMRDLCAAIMELTAPDDDLHVEVRRLLALLDG
jgi:hypothetical protein